MGRRTDVLKGGYAARPCENTLEHCSDEMSTHQIRPGSTIVLLVGVEGPPKFCAGGVFTRVRRETGKE